MYITDIVSSHPGDAISNWRLGLQTLAVAVHNHYKRVKYENQRRKKVQETATAARTSKPLRQDASAMAADIAAKAAEEGTSGNSEDSGSGSGVTGSGDAGGANAEDAGEAANRVGFSGRELADVELDKSNVLLLVSMSHHAALLGSNTKCRLSPMYQSSLIHLQKRTTTQTAMVNRI